MAKLKFDQVGERFYEAGIQECALYVYVPEHESEGVTVPGAYGTGVAWSGISSIVESPSGAEANAVYADNMKYLNLYSAEELGLTIEAYTYPDEWKECDGCADATDGVTLGQQARATFALVYKTLIGSDVTEDEGFKLHVIYGCKASPSERTYETKNDSPDVQPFSWEVSTTPVPVEGMKPTSIITIDSRTANEAKLTALIKTLYGVDPDTSQSITGSDPTLLMPDDLIAAMKPGT